MAHYYQLPNDFYCWGQDRGGTFIPLLSQIFIKIFGCQALIAVSLSNYLLLVLGYLGLSSLIKSRYYKIIFAIIWFLPFQRFVDITRFPIGVEYSLLGIAIYLICKLENRHILGLSTILVFIVSVWVSDLSLVSIAILLIVLLIYYYKDKRSLKIENSIVSYTVLGVVLCLLFISFAKSYASVKTDNYLTVNSVAQIKDALVIIMDALYDVLLFKNKEFPVSIYAYIAIVFFLGLGIFIIKENAFKQLISNKWILFFFIDTVAILGVIILSSWVLANGMGRWYFVATYISLSMTILLIMDYLEKCPKILRYGIMCIAIIGAISPVYTMKYVYPKRLTPMADVVGEFQQLGEIGIIAEYWNAYRTSCTAPDKIVATPHDQSDVRNLKLTDMVFEMDDIYVIKDMWLQSFPDTLCQFGHVLIKTCEPFRLGDCDVCKYDKNN